MNYRNLKQILEGAINLHTSREKTHAEFEVYFHVTDDLYKIGLEATIRSLTKILKLPIEKVTREKYNLCIGRTLAFLVCLEREFREFDEIREKKRTEYITARYGPNGPDKNPYDFILERGSEASIDDEKLEKHLKRTGFLPKPKKEKRK